MTTENHQTPEPPLRVSHVTSVLDVLLSVPDLLAAVNGLLLHSAPAAAEIDGVELFVRMSDEEWQQNCKAVEAARVAVNAMEQAIAKARGEQA